MSMTTTLSFHVGSRFNEKHNNRTIPCPMADKEYEDQHNWYYPNNMSLERAYDFLYKSCFEEYNSSIRKDRRHSSYLEKLQIAQQREQEKIAELRRSGASSSEIRKHRKAVKSAYEIVIGFGNIREHPQFGKNGSMQETAKEILKAYLERLQSESPNVLLYNAAIHTGEQGNLHLHADLVFWAECSRGQKRQTSLTKALAAMGYTTDKEKGADGKRVNAITKWENRQREILRELAKEMADITIVDGKHSQQHKSTEEFKIDQDRLFVEQQAEELAKLQDDFMDYAVDYHSDFAVAYLEHLENVELRKLAEDFEVVQQKNDIALSVAWDCFNSATSEYFDQYRGKKKSLYEEIHRARQGARDSRRQLNSILRDIEYSNSLFINIIRLFVALFLALETASAEREVKRLQEANSALKQQAKEVMRQSNGVSAVLKSKELDDIQEALLDYEIALENAKEFIANPDRWNRTVSLQDYER